MRKLGAFAWAAVFVGAVLGCGREAPPSVSGGAADRVDTLITTGASTIGEVSDLLVGPDGALYVADVQSNGIHVLDSEGRFVQTIGRAGSGPGEFGRPTSLLIMGDTLGVVDSGNGRLQLLSMDGAPWGTRPMPGGYPPPVVSPTGSFIRPTLTLDTTLAAIYGPDQSVRGRIGHIVGTPSNLVRPSEMKAEIQRGEIPNIFLNTAEVAWAGDGSVSLVVPARATVEQFDSLGASRWIVTLEDSLFERVKSEFIRLNGEDTRRFTPLRYVLSARWIGGELWILMGQSAYDSAALVVLDAAGQVVRRLTFRGVREVNNFAVDPRRDWIYFSTAETAEILRTRIAAGR